MPPLFVDYQYLTFTYDPLQINNIALHPEMKWLNRLFLLLSLLLLGGYSHLHAHPQQDYLRYIPAENAHGSPHAGLDALENRIVTMKFVPPGTEKINDKIAVTDKDEEEELSLEKYLDAGKYFTTSFYTLTSRHFSCHVRTCLSVCRHFSFCSAYRYLALRVIRI